MRIAIPEFAVVAIIGTTGSGKSTFCRKHFAPTQVLSSDYFRGLVSDDENNQAVSNEAFEALYHVLGVRLKLGKLSVIDATNVQQESRKKLIQCANEYHALRVAIVLDTPPEVCLERNQDRPDR